MALLWLAFLVASSETQATNRLPAGGSSGEAVEAATDCRDCPEMVPVEIPVATGTRRLMVGRYELTWREYMAAVDSAGCPRPRNRSEGPIDLARAGVRDRHPMSSIAPAEIDCYLNWIRARSGRPYRLPTESEWEAVARAGSGAVSRSVSEVPPDEAFLLKRHSSDAIPSEEDRQAVRSRTVHEVGQRRPDRSGLYDLFGNVAEVLSDPVPPRPSPSGELNLVLIKGGHLLSAPDFDLIRDHSMVFDHLLNGTVGYRLVYDPAD